MSTQCRFCGAAVRPDSMFCPACGQLVGASAAVPPPFPGTAATPAAPTPAAPAVPPAEIAPVPLPVPRRAPEPAVPDPASAPASVPAQPVASAPAPAPESHPEPGAAPATIVLVLPGGAAVPVDRVLVLGRAPESGASSYQGSAVRVDDPGRSMSRVHLVVGPSSHGAVASDPGSANGTQLTRAGQRYQLAPNEPCELVRGDRLELGDAVVTVS